jgi:ubiquinone/menaquinone biosynthesis C-methylase UbiE
MAVLRRILRFPAAALPAPSVEYEAGNAQAYDDRRKGRDVFQWEERIVGELLSSLPKGSTVLDVPVGTGRFIPIYLEIGLTVTGLDLSDDMLAEAARTFEPSAQQVALRRGSATELPFPDQQFDALVSFRFLPGKLTLRQTRRALREYARVTRGNVYVLLKVGERKFPASWRDEFSCLATRPESDLREILRQEGLVVERIERAPRGPKAVFVCRRA